MSEVYFHYNSTMTVQLIAIIIHTNDTRKSIQNVNITYAFVYYIVMYTVVYINLYNRNVLLLHVYVHRR